MQAISSFILKKKQNRHLMICNNLGLYTIFALPGSSGWQNSPTRTTQLKTRLDAAVAMRV